MFQKKISAEDKKIVHSDSSTVDTVVGASVIVEGDFASQGNIIVKGIVSGNVKTSGHLTVERGAKILANIKAVSAEISGEVRGNVKVQDTLELKESAKILGDIEAGILMVAAGAGISGKCNTTEVDFQSLKGELKKEKTSQKKKYEEAAISGLEQTESAVI